jgi:hypothetical protein
MKKKKIKKQLKAANQQIHRMANYLNDMNEGLKFCSYTDCPNSYNYSEDEQEKCCIKCIEKVFSEPSIVDANWFKYVMNKSNTNHSKMLQDGMGVIEFDKQSGLDEIESNEDDWLNGNR